MRKLQSIYVILDGHPFVSVGAIRENLRIIQDLSRELSTLYSDMYKAETNYCNLSEKDCIIPKKIIINGKEHYLSFVWEEEEELSNMDHIEKMLKSVIEQFKRKFKIHMLEKYIVFRNKIREIATDLLKDKGLGFAFFIRDDPVYFTEGVTNKKLVKYQKLFEDKVKKGESEREVSGQDGKDDTHYYTLSQNIIIKRGRISIRFVGVCNNGEHAHVFDLLHIIQDLFLKDLTKSYFDVFFGLLERKEEFKVFLETFNDGPIRFLSQL